MFFAEAARDAEGHLERLAVVEAWITRARIVEREIGLRDPGRAAYTFGHVFAGELEVHAAEDGSLGRVYLHTRFDLAQDVVERSRFVAALGLARIAVHRIGDPEHAAPGALHRGEDTRQAIGDACRAHTRDEHDLAGLVLGAEHLEQAHDVVRLGARADLHADRILDPAEELDVCALELARALADPRKVSREVP